MTVLNIINLNIVVLVIVMISRHVGPSLTFGKSNSMALFD